MLANQAKPAPSLSIRQVQAILAAHREIANVRCQSASFLLESYAKDLPRQFNVFRLLNFAAHEEQYSDVLAVLLDPRGAHGKGSLFLAALLSALPDAPARPILRSVGKYPQAITVRREFECKSSIPDLAIFGPDFVIFIEVKLSGGQETFSQSMPQTVRQWNDLEFIAQERNIPNTLAIKISAISDPPISKQFQHIHIGALQNIFRPIANPHNMETSLASITAFFDFYRE